MALRIVLRGIAVEGVEALVLDLGFALLDIGRVDRELARARRADGRQRRARGDTEDAERRRLHRILRDAAIELHRAADDEKRRDIEDELDARRPRGVADQRVQKLAEKILLGEEPGRVPDRAAERRQNVRLDEEVRALRRHAGREQEDEPARHAEEHARREVEQAEIEREAERRARDHASRAADQKSRRADAAARDAIEKEHDLGTLAQHGHADDDRHRIERPRADRHVMTDRLHLGGEFAAVAVHPDIVPAEHRHGDEENAGVEDFLAGAFERARDRAREARDQRRAGEARDDAEHEPARASRNALGRRRDDAQNERGFDDFAENDDQRGEHEGEPLLT